MSSHITNPFALRDAGFAAGTLIHTKEGLVAIETLRVGDWVLSKPKDGKGQQAYKRVTKTFRSDDREVVAVSVNTGSDSGHNFLVATRNQPFGLQEISWDRYYACQNSRGASKIGAHSPTSQVDPEDGKPAITWTRSIEFFNVNASWVETKNGGGAKAEHEPLFITGIDHVAWQRDALERDCDGSLVDFRSGRAEYEFRLNKGSLIDLKAFLDDSYDFEGDGSNYGANPLGWVIYDEPNEKFRCTVYNIGVEDFHTYYAGLDGIWVHDGIGDGAQPETLQDLAVSDSQTREGLVAGTLVHTQTGLMPIERIQVDDWILAKAEHGDEPGYYRVAKVLASEQQALMFIRYMSDQLDDAIQEICVTTNYPFWCRDMGWTRACRLPERPVFGMKEGITGRVISSHQVFFTKDPDLVVTEDWREEGFVPYNLEEGDPILKEDYSDRPDNSYVRLESGEIHDSTRKVFNLEIESAKIFFVGEAGAEVCSCISDTPPQPTPRFLKNDDGTEPIPGFFYGDGTQIKKNDAVLVRDGRTPGQVKALLVMADSNGKMGAQAVLLVDGRHGNHPQGIDVPPRPDGRFPEIIFVERDTKDCEKAGQNWMLEKSWQGDPLAQFVHGYHLSRVDIAQALVWWEKSANGGNLAAQFHLGYLYYHSPELPSANLPLPSHLRCLHYLGRDVPRDQAKGLYWLRRAAQGGHPESQYQTGLACFLGWGGAPDKAQAVDWFFKAASQGLDAAQRSLAWCYEQGNGITQNHRQAADWYLKAAQQGEASAQCKLAELYERGLGVKQDYQKAIVWYRRASSQGVGDAAYKLGCLYNWGLGVKKNRQRAIDSWRTAAKNGSEEAKKRLAAESMKLVDPNGH